MNQSIRYCRIIWCLICILILFSACNKKARTTEHIADKQYTEPFDDSVSLNESASINDNVPGGKRS